MRRPLYALTHEVVAHYLGLEGKLWRTLGVLVARPGALTVAYLEGERERHIRPVRLYLTASVLLFFLVSVLPGGWSGAIAGFSDAVGSAERTAEATAREMAEELEQVRAEIAALDVSRAALQARADTLERALAAGAAAPDVSAEAGPEGFWDRVGASLGAQGERVSAMGEAEAKAYFAAAFARHMPKAMFLLLPLFALLLKVLYIRRRRYYGEHLVFALHAHAFTFFCYLALALFMALTARFDALPAAVSALLMGGTAALVFAPAVHTTLALRRVYRQGWGRTLLKAGLLLWTYFVVLNLAVAGVIVLAVLLA